MKKLLLVLILFGIAPVLADDSEIHFYGIKTEPDMIRQGQSPAMEKALLDELVAILGLNKNQIQEVRALRLRTKNKMNPLLDMQRSKFFQLRSPWNKNPEKTHQELRQLNSELLKVREQNEKEFEAILDDKQRAQYRKMKEEHQKGIFKP